MAELAVYEDAGGLDDGAVPDVPALTRRLRADGARRLLADAATSATVARAGVDTLIANGALDSHGRADPPARLAVPVRLSASDALLVAVEDVEELRVRLRSEGVGFREAPLGDRVLVHRIAPVVPPAPCRTVAWRVEVVSGSADGGQLTSVVEGRLPELRRLLGIRIEHPLVSSRHVAVQAVHVSTEGRTWRALDGARRLTPWGWAGLTLFRYSGGLEEIWVPPSPVRWIRVRLATPDVEGRSPVERLCVRAEAAT